MSDAVADIVREWELPVWLTASIVLTGVVYVRGWFAIRRSRPRQFKSDQLGFFLSGLAVLWVAIASPMDGFADRMLSAHMVEHLLLMSVIPPLVLLGLPTVPLLRGLPRPAFHRRSAYPDRGPAAAGPLAYIAGGWMRCDEPSLPLVARTSGV
jgi:cytochrome c oxidase assembly factor CtaG